MNRLEGLPPVYCLTLKGETERQIETQRQAARYGANVEFFYGYDGRVTDYKNNPSVYGVYFQGMSSGDIACSMGHISMIRQWLNTSSSDVAFFIEDDINLENCENWNFSWNDMMALLPQDWEAVQLALIRSDPITEVRFRTRVTADWCVTAYILKRSYAEWLVSQYFKEDGRIFLHTPGDPRATPIVENAVYFPAEPHVYSFPIFTEKNTYASTFFGDKKKVKTHNDNSEKAITAWWHMNGASTNCSKFFEKSDLPPSSPRIGTAVVKNPVWVKRLVESVDYPVEEFLIINNNGRGEIDAQLDEIARVGNPMIKRVRVLHMPSNLGVAGSWNLMIKSYLKSPFWIIVNDDVAFCPGFLAEMHTETQRDPGAGMIHGFEGDHGIGSWDLFLIRDHVIQEYGLFDESLYPAYNEDADYFLRFIHKPVRRIMNLKTEYLHGDGKKADYHTHGSQTAKTNPVLREKLNRVNLTNFTYMEKKWGQGWRSCNVTPTPFVSTQGHGLPLSTTTFDLEFVRSKHLGF